MSKSITFSWAILYYFTLKSFFYKLLFWKQKQALEELVIAPDFSFYHKCNVTGQQFILLGISYMNHKRLSSPVNRLSINSAVGMNAGPTEERNFRAWRSNLISGTYNAK